VEDNLDELEFLSGLLKFQNVIVSQATNIAGALEFLSGPVQFQIAFVDLNLANSSGVEVIRRIKKGSVARLTQVVVVTGTNEAQKLMLATEFGYVGVLRKPYAIDSIREILYHHRLPRGQ